MKKIYVDITQLYNWQGKVTGIQRVMDEISRRFITDDEFSPVFLVWQKNTASFYEVDYSDTAPERDRQQEVSAVSPAATQSPSILTKAIRLMKKVYFRVPLARKAYNRYSSFNSRLLAVFKPEQVVAIDDDAVLFMPHGGVWESETYIAKILDLKKNHNVKLVTILYDTVPALLPQFAVEAITIVFSNYMSQVLPKSDLVLAISENTAKDARRWLKMLNKPAAPITVFRLGDEVGQQDPKPVEAPKEFILCVGTLEVRKNHAALYYAYKLAAQEGKQLPPVMIVGRVGWMAGDIYHLMRSDPETKDSFIFLHGASDEELAWLYQHALFSVYPSFYEGWGLPIAESLLRGTPCLASNISSIPEIAGDLVDYFSPYSPEQMKDKIYQYASDRKLLATLQKKIKTQYKTTTWDMSYQQVSQAIKDIAK